MELISVIGIAAVMMGLAIPSLSSFKNGADISGVYLNIEKTIESGRAQAMALGTHVWIGFSEVTENGEKRVEVTAFASQDGSDDGSSANLRQIWKVRGFPGMRLGSETELKGLAQAYSAVVPEGISVARPAEVDAALRAGTSGGERLFTDCAIEFSPRGEVVNASGSWVGVPLIPVRGGNRDQAKQSGCLLVSKASGAILVTRL